jgi:hypothetical protein
MCDLSFKNIILEEELRKLLKVNKLQLSNMRKKGLPFIELSRIQRLYLEGSVLKWLSERESVAEHHRDTTENS